MNSRRLGGLPVLLLCCAALPSAFAQGSKPLNKYVPRIDKGDVEVGGFVGGSYGFDSWHLFGGGNVAVAVQKNIMPYFEYSYFPNIPRPTQFNTQTITLNGQQITIKDTFTYTSRIQDFHGGVHIRVQPAGKSIVPYAVIGVGGLATKLTTDHLVQQTNQADQHLTGTSNSTQAAVNFGGGLRWYAAEKFGMRLEYKIYKPVSGDYKDTFQKVEVGFFFQRSPR